MSASFGSDFGADFGTIGVNVGSQLLLKQRIALELARPDIIYTDARIASAIYDAISMYQKEKFRFSEINPASPPTFNTAYGVWTYGASALADIGNNFFINFLTYTLGTQTFFVNRTDPLEVVLANQNLNITGPPERFAYEGETIMLTPVPDQVYLMTLDAHLLVPAPTSDTQAGNRWMIDAEMLIRSRAKFEIATHVTRNPAMAMAMSPEANGGPGGGPGATWRAFRALKAESNRLIGTGRVKSMAW